MPLPALDPVIHVLPPHIGDPRLSQDLSPYPTSAQEFCAAFGTSAHRRDLLHGFLDFRALLRAHGFLGFQWIGGSFVENKEALDGRPPQDVDVVTFYFNLTVAQQQAILAAEPILADQAAIEHRFHVHHFPMDAAYHPVQTVQQVRYWVNFLTHRRGDPDDPKYRYGIWKGIVAVDLTPDDRDDQQARQLLRGGTTS